MKKILFILFMVFCLSGSAQTIFYVTTTGAGNELGDSWANASKDLQTVINQAQPGNQIWVANGIYYPSTLADPTSLDEQDKAFVLKKDIQIYGGFSGNESNLNDRDTTSFNTILSGYIADGIGLHHVIIAAGDMGTACLNGFMIRQGAASGIDSILVNNESIPRDRGGGIINEKTTNSPLTYANLLIFQNTALSSGGGMHNDNSNPILRNIHFKSNTTNLGNGGGIYNNTSSPLLSNCEFSLNGASQGGGIYNYNSSPIFNHTIISQNSAYQGGGIYNHIGGTPTFINTLINDNTVSASGGGIYNQNSLCVLINVTIAGNYGSGGQGYGLFQAGSSPILIENSIIWGNGDFNIYSVSATTPIYKYSLVQNEDLSASEGCFDGTQDPLFINTTFNNYRLQAGSTVINKGNKNLYLDNGFINENELRFDLDNNLRISQGAIDLGAYEYQCMSTPIAAFLNKDTTICEGNTIELNTQISGDGIPLYDFMYTRTNINGTDTIKIVAYSNTSATITETPLTKTSYKLISIKDGNECITVLEDSIAVTVNPKPILNNTLTNQNLCSGEFTTNITFESTNATKYEWTNTGNTISGLPSGVIIGNFGQYQLTNTNNTILNAIIEVTPYYLDCAGSSKTFSISVKPTTIPIIQIGVTK